MTKVHFPADAKLRATLTSRGAPLSRDFVAGVDIDIPDPEWQVIKETWGHKSPAVTPEVFVAPISYRVPTYSMATRIPWWGAGTTRTATSVADFATQYAASADGDTIQWANGTYAVAAPIVIAKKIRIKAQNPRQAIFTGGTAPTSATNDPGHTVYCFRTNSAAADGVYFEDMHFKYFGVSIDLDSTKNAVVQGNKIETNYDIGVQVWDCISPIIQMNGFFDPFLGGDSGSTATLTFTPVVDAMMDYAINVYGSTNPKVLHNYFHGIFNQVISFKEGSLNPTCSYNTIEGSALTAILFGQNKPGGNGPYGDTGLPIGVDKGIMECKNNVIRPVLGADGFIYRTNIGIRYWHVDGQMTPEGNVIEGCAAGILIEGKEATVATRGYATGTATISKNTIGGSWRTPDTNVAIQVKTPVRVASTANITIPPGGTTLTIDGVPLSNGDRVLLKNQTSVPTNGIYTVGGVGGSVTLTRATDSDTWEEVYSTQVAASQGTVNGGLTYRMTGVLAGTIGATNITYATTTQYDTATLIDMGNNAIRLYKGIYASAVIAENDIVLHDVPTNYCFDDGAYVGALCPSYSETLTNIVTTATGDMRLRTAAETYDPDLTYSRLFPRTNEVTNPSFESGVTDWVTSGINALAAGATLTRSAVGGSAVGSGLYVGNIATNGTTNSGAAIPIKLKGGYPYRIRIRFKRSAGTATAKIAIQKSISPFTETVLAATASDAAMVEYTTLFTPDADGTYHLYCRQNAGTSSTFQIDAAFASPYDVPYFDGDTAWNRVVNRNGPSTVGWTCFSASPGVETLSIGSDVSFDGAGIVSAVTAHTSGNDWYVIYGDPTTGVGKSIFGCEAGEVYGIRMRVKLLTTLPTSASIKLYGGFQNSTFTGSTDVLAHTQVMPAPMTGVNFAGSVLEMTGVISAPAARVWAYPQLIITMAASAATVVVGRIQMVKLTSVGDTNPAYMAFDRTGWDSAEDTSTSWSRPRV